jgi:hypothetical protein
VSKCTSCCRKNKECCWTYFSFFASELQMMRTKENELFWRWRTPCNLWNRKCDWQSVTRIKEIYSDDSYYFLFPRFMNEKVERWKKNWIIEFNWVLYKNLCIHENLSVAVKSRFLEEKLSNAFSSIINVYFSNESWMITS